MAYELPTLQKPAKTTKKQVLLVASGDLRSAANQNCWPAQKGMEDALARKLIAVVGAAAPPESILLALSGQWRGGSGH